MIKSEYQEWNDGQLIHGYIEFDRTKAIVNGNEKAVSRYDYCLHQFMKINDKERKRGIIYGGIDFDFWLVEVDQWQ